MKGASLFNGGNRPASAVGIVGGVLSWSMVQLTDFHLVEAGRLAMDVVDTGSFLQRAVATICSLSPSPDLVVATGDLVDDGRQPGYERLAELLSPIRCPIVLLPGNHDDLDTMRDAFATPGPGPLVPNGTSNTSGLADMVIDGAVTVVALDCSRAPDPGGRLDATQLDWLDSVLTSRSDRPAVVTMHHPPFATGIRGMDAMALDSEDANRLAEVIARHPQVERICCGHVHRAVTRRWAGTIAAVSPGVAQSVAFDLQDGPLSWALEPPAVTLLIWSPDLGLVSHQVPIGDFPPTAY